jgi:hypothetical protein
MDLNKIPTDVVYIIHDFIYHNPYKFLTKNHCCSFKCALEFLHNELPNKKFTSYDLSYDCIGRENQGDRIVRRETIDCYMYGSGDLITNPRFKIKGSGFEIISFKLLIIGEASVYVDYRIEKTHKIDEFWISCPNICFTRIGVIFGRFMFELKIKNAIIIKKIFTEILLQDQSDRQSLLEYPHYIDKFVIAHGYIFYDKDRKWTCNFFTSSAETASETLFDDILDKLRLA